LFREYLRANFCEENLSFWLDVQDFKRKFGTTSSAVALPTGKNRGTGVQAMERHQQDLIAMAFVIYNSEYLFLSFFFFFQSLHILHTSAWQSIICPMLPPHHPLLSGSRPLSFYSIPHQSHPPSGRKLTPSLPSPSIPLRIKHRPQPPSRINQSHANGQHQPR